MLHPCCIPVWASERGGKEGKLRQRQRQRVFWKTGKLRRVLVWQIASVLRDFLRGGAADAGLKCPLAIFTPHPPPAAPFNAGGGGQFDDTQLLLSVKTVVKYIQLVAGSE
jgi:hypothetical protein